MTHENRKAYLDKHHAFTVRTEEVPKPGPYEVVIRIMANGICGSDIHFYSEGRLGNFIVQEPYVPGHECSGEITSVGSNVNHLVVGDLVTIEPGIPCRTCRHCRIGRYNLCSEVVFLSAPPMNGTFCDFICIRSDMVHRLPKGLSFEEGAMAEPAAVAVHAVNRAKLGSGKTVAVVGAGPIGQFTIQAIKAAGGGRVICLDTNQARLEFAARIGADETINPTDICTEELKDVADVVFETAGADRATASLFAYTRPGGCAVQVGWPESNIVNMDISRFIEKELDYVAVHRYANAFEAAIQWISDGRIDAKSMITHRFELEQIAEAFAFTKNNPQEVMKTVVLNKM